MNEPYASAVGTTVLQLKDIPDRPARFDGKLCVFGPKEGVDEAKIRTAFKEVAESISMEATPSMPQKWVVQFATHELALEAKRACGNMSELWSGLDTLYNERPYDDRGWCCFEDIASVELILRLASFPEMRDALSVLPPKVLSISADGTPQPLVLHDQHEGGHVLRAVERILKVAFPAACYMNRKAMLLSCIHTSPGC